MSPVSNNISKLAINKSANLSDMRLRAAIHSICMDFRDMDRLVFVCDVRMHSHLNIAVIKLLEYDCGLSIDSFGVQCEFQNDSATVFSAVKVFSAVTALPFTRSALPVS